MGILTCVSSSNRRQFLNVLSTGGLLHQPRISHWRKEKPAKKYKHPNIPDHTAYISQKPLQLTVGVHSGVDGVVRFVFVDEKDLSWGTSIERVVAGVARHQVIRARFETKLVEKTGDSGRNHGSPVVVGAVPHAGHQGDLHISCIFQEEGRGGGGGRG